MDFLWVRWLGVVPGHSFSSKQAKLPQVRFVEDLNDFTFSFLDPALMIHGCHLIPAFAEGKTAKLLSTCGPTEARSTSKTDDWTNYYVNM